MDEEKLKAVKLTSEARSALIAAENAIHAAQRSTGVQAAVWNDVAKEVLSLIQAVGLIGWGVKRQGRDWLKSNDRT